MGRIVEDISLDEEKVYHLIVFSPLRKVRSVVFSSDTIVPISGGKIERAIETA